MLGRQMFGESARAASAAANNSSAQPLVPNDRSDRYADTDSDDYDSYDEYDPFEDVAYFQDDLPTGTMCLGICENYVPTWQPRHGWREFYQNWNDAIKETNGLGIRAFIKKTDHKKNFLIFKAVHPDTEQELGFIRFSKQAGTIELANYNAQLSGKTLGLGYTSKDSKSHLAGAHGEGYKIASLTMVRNGYPVTFKASSAEWKFMIPGPEKRNGGYFCCKIRKINESQIETMKNSHSTMTSRARQPPLKSNVWSDVCVKIGGGRTGDKIGEEEFRRWLDQSLDLNPPLQVVKTERGDLILETAFSNKLFLKGLLLERALSRRPFKFGYNLDRGKVNRDRETMADLEEQMENLTAIWAEAIQIRGSTSLPEYFEMLQDEERWADVEAADEYVSVDTAKAIRHYLQDQDPDNKKFYYRKQDSGQNVEIIVESLRKEPSPLSNLVWNSLRKYKLLRTPEEQRHHLLFNAQDSTATRTPYSEGVIRAVKAVLELDERTQNYKLVFKSGENAELDLLLDGQQFLINDKWLDFNSSHKSSYCVLHAEATEEKIAIDTFSCIHIVEKLYSLILNQLPRDVAADSSVGAESGSNLVRSVSEKLRQIPHKVECVARTYSGEVVVSWIHPESEKDSKLHGITRHGCVTLHRESTCADKKKDLLTPCGSTPQTLEAPFLPNCDCPQKDILLKDATVTFQELNLEEEYFPMVSAAGSQAFYALPPPPIRPSLSPIRGLSSSAVLSPFPSPLATPEKRENSTEIDYGDLYGNSDDDENDGSFELDSDVPTGSSDHSSVITSPSARAQSNSSQATDRRPSYQSLSSEMQILQLRRQLGNAASTRRQLESRQAELLRDLAEKTIAKGQLEVRISALVKENAEGRQISQQLKTAYSRIRALEDDVAILKRDKEDLNQEIKAVVAAKNAAMKKREEVQEANILLKKELSSQNRQLAAALLEIHKLRVSLEKAMRDLQKKDGDLEEAVQALEKMYKLFGKPAHVDEISVESEQTGQKDNKIKNLLEEQELLMARVKDSEDKWVLMSNTLSSVLALIQNILAMNPRLSIRAILEDVANMIKGRLDSNSGKRHNSRESTGDEEARRAKRARVEEVPDCD